MGVACGKRGFASFKYLINVFSYKVHVAMATVMR